MTIGRRQPVLAIPHGGGPCFSVALPPPFTPDVWEPLKAHLTALGAGLDPRPSAVLVVSGHWEEHAPTVNTAVDHSLLYDYYGFPAEAYQLNYPAKGAPATATRVRSLLADAKIDTREDAARGLDHGVFVPFMVMFPDADLPIVQLSLQADLDPAFHLAFGRALAPLRDEGVLIVGSGNSYHNLRQWRAHGGADEDARQFDGWLNETMTEVDAQKRQARLIGWEAAPGAKSCHPRAEHLLPYHVAAGAAGADAGLRIFNGEIAGKATSGFRFG